jgi:RNA:NAD 2'-phosphotransferase (TPT1/KptA family)
MILYHGTQNWRLPSIRKHGLRPNSSGIVYLSPTIEGAKSWGDGTVLEIDTKELRLTAFDDCKEWEVLCWTGSKRQSISPQQIKEIVL